MNSVRFNLKRALVSVLCLATVLGTAFYTATFAPVKSVKAATIQDYKDQIAELEKEQQEIQEEIDRLKGDKSDQNKVKSALQKKISNLQSQISACNKQIDDLDTEILRLEADTEQKTNELENAKYTFRQRLRALYMSGGAVNSSLAMILSADSLDDMLRKAETTKSISAYDNALMDKILNDMKTIENNKKRVNELLDEQKGTKALLADKKNELNKQIKEVNSTLAGIDSDIDSLKDKAEELEKAQKEYEEAIKNAQNVGSDQKYDGDFSWPCPGYYYVSSPYGYRNHPISGKYKFHKGIDIAGGGIKGKPIVAAADGIVSIATYNSGGYGHYVMVNHGTGKDGKSYVTLYAHMTRYIVSVGQYVKKGQTIGYVGTSGASTGYHLHFEIRANGETTNPMSYF